MFKNTVSQIRISIDYRDDDPITPNKKQNSKHGNHKKCHHHHRQAKTKSPTSTSEAVSTAIVARALNNHKKSKGS